MSNKSRWFCQSLATIADKKQRHLWRNVKLFSGFPLNVRYYFLKNADGFFDGNQHFFKNFDGHKVCIEAQRLSRFQFKFIRSFKKHIIFGSLLTFRGCFAKNYSLLARKRRNKYSTIETLGPLGGREERTFRGFFSGPAAFYRFMHLCLPDFLKKKKTFLE